MASATKSANNFFESVISSLPTDKDRVMLLKKLLNSPRPVQLYEISKDISKTSQEAAEIIVAAAKEGLVEFVENNQALRLTDYGRKVAASVGLL